jgi:signal transduction histidine kinase
MIGGQLGDGLRAQPPDEAAIPWQQAIPGEAEPGPVARSGLRILILEDEPSDAELEQRLLKSAGLDCTAVVVDGKEAFIQQLGAFHPDVILSDYSLPGFSGEDALRITREGYPHVPFIFLSGALGDDAAVELIRQGATDYVLKDRPARLASVVLRAVGEAKQRAERARLEAQLEQARRLEGLGRLAGGVAHDFNNLLGVISNYTAFVGQELAKEPLQIDLPVARADIAEVAIAVERAARLTRQLLAFARREVAQPRVLSINDAIAAVKHRLLSSLGEQVEMATVLAGDLGLVFADAAQIELILVNLAVNARDAMPHGGILTIETANTNVDETYAAGRTGLQPGSYVSVKVSDTGIGIPKDVIDRVFEPFFTTKSTGAGTGLGLATVYGITRQAGGAVWICSEPGLGTSVTLLLPVTGRAGASAQPSSRGPDGAGMVVLVVEDEPAVRELTRRILDRNGYRVLTAASGHDAVETAGQQGRLDVLITDVVMPKMQGKEVADRVRALHPGILVLFMSGYTQGLLSAQGILGPGLNLIEKPFSQASLLAKLEDVVGQPARVSGPGPPRRPR